jgi:hypothetical protein
MTDIPDDLSGIDAPPPLRVLGDIDPALLAAYDQTLQYLRQVSHRLFYLTMSAQMLDPKNPEHAPHIHAHALEAAELVFGLDEQHKSLLINILIGQLAAAANKAIDRGWLPTNSELDDPIGQEEVAAMSGVPMEQLQKVVAELKARRAQLEGDAQADAPGHQPPAGPAD